MYYNDQLTEKDGQLSRYRVALGIDPATKGALIELNNLKLRAKSETVVERLRSLCFAHKNAINGVYTEQKKNNADKETFAKQINAIHFRCSRELIKIRSDTFNVDNEFRRRLSAQALAAIPGVMPPLYSDDGTKIDILTFSPSDSGIDISFVCPLADGLESMAKLLP